MYLARDFCKAEILSGAFNRRRRLKGQKLELRASGACEVKWSESHSVVPDSLQPHGLYSSWNSLGQNTEVGILSLLQGIFPTQGSNPGLLHCRWILYQLSHKGSPRILEWVAYPFSSGSSWPRNRTGCPELQEDSLPTELSGKPLLCLYFIKRNYQVPWFYQFQE